MANLQGGWLRGVIKEVISGDTVVIQAPSKGGIPPEKKLLLSSLVAPRMGRRDGSTRDEPFAWQSREFLRRLAVGKPCVFREDYRVDAAGGLEFGTVFINDKDNIALQAVAAGWARVRPSAGAQNRNQSPFYEELIKAQEAAEAKNLGVHTKDAAAATASVRNISHDFDASAYLKRIGKGKSVSAIIESAISGSTLRVTLLPDLISATVMVAGVQCPSMGRKSAVSAAPTDGGEDAKVSGPTAAAALAAGVPEGQPEPLAREARHFTELRCLNREVKLVLEGISQFGVLVASVHCPAPNADAPPIDLGNELLKSGLGKAAEWSLNMMTSGAFKLREAERAARQSRLGLWRSYVPQTSGNSAKMSDKFTGVVAEVVSGDCLIVRDAANNMERRVMLSSIRAPRGATRDRAGEPWSAEAKEFLRQRLIGKEVSVSMEYVRKVPPAPGSQSAAGSAAATGGQDRVMAFGTVTTAEKGSGTAGAPATEPKINNVAELLLVRGLAQVTKHRADEERSAHFEDLINAEEAAKKGKKGIFGNKQPATPRVNDVTAPGSAARAKQYLPFLQRAGKITGVVEYVLGGSRLKIHIPKEGATIAFSPSAVRCPARDEPFAAEALAFTRMHCLQREVEIEVGSIDKAGTFLGTLKIGRAFNLGVALLEAGLAQLHYSFQEDHQLEAAQAKAQKAKAGMWVSFDPDAAKAAETASGNNANEGALGAGQKREFVEITVTDVTDANNFYIQLASEARTAWVADQLSSMSLDSTPAPSSLFKPGDKCLAKFAADGLWYRAQVEKVHSQDPTAPVYDVMFLDYGNKDKVAAHGVRQAPPELVAVPAQAHPAGLAFVHAPSLDADYGVEAAQALSEYVGGGKKLKAVIEGKERNGGAASIGVKKKGWGNAAASNTIAGTNASSNGPAKLLLTVLLGDGAADDSVNSELVRQGLARVIQRGRTAAGPGPTMSKDVALVYDALKTAEDEARRGHRGQYLYGDPGSDSEDEARY